MQKHLISQIKGWFKAKGYVYMFIDNGWIGRPWDNFYTLTDIHYDSDANLLTLALGENWFLYFSGGSSGSPTISDNELVFNGFDNVILEIKDYRTTNYGSVEVKFFIEDE